jgi:psp operon transcriptional activator
LRNKWPGNVRELKYTIERSIYRAADPGKPISRLALDPFASPFRLESPAPATVLPSIATSKPRAPLLPADLKGRLQDLEQDLLTAALEKARFNQRAAAELLQLSYHQFRNRLRKFKINSKP